MASCRADYEGNVMTCRSDRFSERMGKRGRGGHKEGNLFKFKGPLSNIHPLLLGSAGAKRNEKYTDMELEKKNHRLWFHFLMLSSCSYIESR